MHEEDVKKEEVETNDGYQRKIGAKPVLKARKIYQSCSAFPIHIISKTNEGTQSNNWSMLENLLTP